MNAFRLCTVVLAMTIPLGISLGTSPAGAQQPNPIPQKFQAIYPEPGKAESQVREALALAAKQKKKLILDFGADQCADCQVLSGFWGTTTNRSQVAEHFLLVHVNVGPRGDQNAALAQRFQAPVKQGLPVVVVADPQGHVLKVSDEFKRAHNESAEDLTGFLNKAQ